MKTKLILMNLACVAVGMVGYADDTNKKDLVFRPEVQSNDVTYLMDLLEAGVGFGTLDIPAEKSNPDAPKPTLKEIPVKLDALQEQLYSLSRLAIGAELNRTSVKPAADEPTSQPSAEEPTAPNEPVVVEHSKKPEVEKFISCALETLPYLKRTVRATLMNEGAEAEDARERVRKNRAVIEVLGVPGLPCGRYLGPWDSAAKDDIDAAQTLLALTSGEAKGIASPLWAAYTSFASVQRESATVLSDIVVGAWQHARYSAVVKGRVVSTKTLVDTVVDASFGFTMVLDVAGEKPREVKFNAKDVESVRRDLLARLTKQEKRVEEYAHEMR